MYGLAIVKSNEIGHFYWHSTLGTGYIVRGYGCRYGKRVRWVRGIGAGYGAGYGVQVQVGCAGAIGGKSVKVRGVGTIGLQEITT